MQTLVSLTDTSSPTKWSMLLLLRMLEAANVDLVFTISLKRSTQNLQLSTNRRPITPSCGALGGPGILYGMMSAPRPKQTLMAFLAARDSWFGDVSRAGGDMRRRDFIVLLAGAARLPAATRAQQARLPLVGLVSIGATANDPGLFGPFLDQMGQLGYIVA